MTIDQAMKCARDRDLGGALRALKDGPPGPAKAAKDALIIMNEAPDLDLWHLAIARLEVAKG